MKRIQNLIIFFLCLCVVGFFANFAQNDYGISLVIYAMLLIGVLFIELMRQTILKYKYLGFTLYIIVIFPVLSMFIYVYNKGEAFLYLSLFLMVIGALNNVIVLPLIIFFSEKKTGIEKIDFKSYFELLFLSFLPIGFYLKFNHLFGAAPIFVLSMLILFSYIINISKRVFLLIKNRTSLELFQIVVYLYITLSVLGTVFKIQHWPGGNAITKVTLTSLFISIAIIIYTKLIKRNVKNLFESMQPITKIIYVTYCVTGLWLSLKFVDLAPAVYSDEDPTALEMLKANANDFTEEGKEYTKKYKTYKENMEMFTLERNKELEKK